MVRAPAGDQASEWAMRSIAEKVDCPPEMLRPWERQAGRHRGARAGLSSDGRARRKALVRAVRERRQASESLRKASAYVAAAELDRRPQR